MLSTIDILSRAYAEPNATDRLKVYPTFALYRVLQYRASKFNKDTPILGNKLIDIELRDTGMSEDPTNEPNEGT